MLAASTLLPRCVGRGTARSPGSRPSALRWWLGPRHPPVLLSPCACPQSPETRAEVGKGKAGSRGSNSRVFVRSFLAWKANPDPNAAIGGAL